MQHFQEGVIINSALSVRIQVADDLASFGMCHLGFGQRQYVASSTPPLKPEGRVTLSDLSVLDSNSLISINASIISWALI